MYKVLDKTYEHYVSVRIKLNESTVQYRNWLNANVGREYHDWAIKMVNINHDSFTLLVFLHEDAHLAMFKLAML